MSHTVRTPRRVARLRLLSLATLLLAVPASGLSAQSAGEPRTLTIADYALWRTITDQTISADGRWVAWTYERERSDSELHVRALDSDVEHVIERATDPELSADGRWVAYFVSLPFAEAEELRRDGETETRKAELLDLTTGEKRSWEDATSFGFSDGSTHLYVKKRAADSDAEHEGTDLILRNLREGFEELIGSADEVAFNDGGTLLAYTVDAAEMDGNGLYLVTLADGSRRALENAKERFSSLTWSEDGSAVAVLRGTTPDGKVERENAVVAFTGVGRGSPRRVVFEADGAGLPAGWIVSANGDVSWNDGATMLLVDLEPQEDELEEWPDDALPLADVNIWHWADDRIQSAQEQSADFDRDRTYTAVLHMEDAKLVPLADERMRDVQVTRDGRWAIGRDATEFVSDWRPEYADWYRIDTRTGERALFLEAHLRTLSLSPDGRHFLYWKDGDVWDYRIAENRHVNLTESSPVDFTDAEFDYFGEKPPYGVTGFTADGRSVILTHRYDLWLQPLDGSAATNLTQGRGARDEIELRWVRTDPEERAIDLSRPMLLSAYGQWTKQEGFFELRGRELRELTLEDRRFGFPQKAEDADRYLFTVQTFRDFPDLWVSRGRDFTGRTRVTEANPQQAEFKWGRRILFDYTNNDGVRLQGTLAIPDDYRTGQRLPMIVRFYEKYSQDMHAYPTPRYVHAPNFADYVSNGYLVMQPDVHFRIGSSHSDMLECVEAAVRAVIEMGYADPDAVGLSGHSYSGGGGAYIATRSTMFAAVAHGAAPINLVSEFNQLFVGSGENNHQYDIHGQGRYATNPYDDFQLYWDQSPISGVETMNTPVLYLHGESDPTVNWEQGLEWYNALRFLGKPIIWLSYPDEGHGLRKLENRIDFQVRLHQFFDHHLKGAPAPAWMTEGVPYIEKARHMREFAPGIFGAGSDTTVVEPAGAGSNGRGSR